jgi:hypothetical protein
LGAIPQQQAVIILSKLCQIAYADLYEWLDNAVTYWLQKKFLIFSVQEVQNVIKAE